MAEYKPIEISEMRTRITLQSPTISTDDGGAQVPGWTTEDIVWARWVAVHGQEAISSGSLAANQRAVVTLRYGTAIKTTWQVLRDGEAWQVLSVDEVRDRNRYTEVIVERVQGSL